MEQTDRYRDERTDGQVPQCGPLEQLHKNTIKDYYSSVVIDEIVAAYKQKQCYAAIMAHNAKYI